MKLENETVWLTQSQIATLFKVDRSVIVKHILNVYKSKELRIGATCAKIAQVEGKRKVNRNITFYNLDMILYVGYRINSKNE